MTNLVVFMTDKKTVPKKTTTKRSASGGTDHCGDGSRNEVGPERRPLWTGGFGSSRREPNTRPSLGR